VRGMRRVCLTSTLNIADNATGDMRACNRSVPYDSSPFANLPFNTGSANLVLSALDSLSEPPCGSRLEALPGLHADLA